jgi:hypothetical protein
VGTFRSFSALRGKRPLSTHNGLLHCSNLLARCASDLGAPPPAAHVAVAADHLAFDFDELGAGVGASAIGGA